MTYCEDGLAYIYIYIEYTVIEDLIISYVSEEERVSIRKHTIFQNITPMHILKQYLILD